MLVYDSFIDTVKLQDASKIGLRLQLTGRVYDNQEGNQDEKSMLTSIISSSHRRVQVPLPLLPKSTLAFSMGPRLWQSV